VGFLLVFLGAGIGGALRHGVNLVALRMFGAGFPIGTLFINVSGSFVMGIVAEYWAIKSGLPQPMRLFLTTGILGGFTTFSAFSLEVALLWERGQPLLSAVYVTASVALSVAALFGGLSLVRILDGRGIM
jgi:fluoride exporter